MQRESYPHPKKNQKGLGIHNLYLRNLNRFTTPGVYVCVYMYRRSMLVLCIISIMIMHLQSDVCLPAFTPPSDSYSMIDTS